MKTHHIPLVTASGFVAATLLSFSTHPTLQGTPIARPQVTLGVVARAQSMACFSRCREVEAACQSACWEETGACQRSGTASAGGAVACSLGRETCVQRCRDTQAACSRGCF